MAIIDGSSGLVPGFTLANYGAVVIQMGATTKLEILNDNPDHDLWFAINPAGNDFAAPNAVGTQYVRPGEWLDVTTTGSPIVVLKSSRPVQFQVRKLA